MYVGLSFFSTRTIYPTINDISIMLFWSLDAIAIHFWWPVKFKNMENADFEDIKNCGKCIYLTEHNILFSIFLFCKRNSFFLPSPFFESTIME